jgi:hypothetical protein
MGSAVTEDVAKSLANKLAGILVCAYEILAI